VSGQSEMPVPERIGKYEIVDVLGRGGMGVVYRARDSRIGRNVAIKTLTEGFSGNPEMLKRFYQEAGHTGNLRHSNIVIIYDFGDEEGLPYIVMEYLDGEPLDRLIRERTTLHLYEKLNIVEQVCTALAYAHTQGIIHRDVKPANIIVQRDGLVKLLDFGIARTGERQSDLSMTRTGTLVGTPAYMAPERLRGDSLDGRSDIFAVGVVLYQLLSGALPFDAEYPEILNQIFNQEPPPLEQYLASYPPQLDQILGHALAKKSQDRYSSASDMAADLGAVAAQLKEQRIAEMMEEAHTSFDQHDFIYAKQLIAQILRIDSQHVEAKKLMTKVNQFLNLQELRRRLDILVKTANEAIDARNWDQAKALCTDALHMDPDNAEAMELLAKADAGKQKREQIQKLLREAEVARNANNLELATECARQASILEPGDSRILAICNALEKEAEAERTRNRIRKYLEKAQEHLVSLRFVDAGKALAKAERLDPIDPDLMRLKDELAEAIQQAEQKRLVDALEEKATAARTLEQMQLVNSEILAALEKFSSEPTLLRLKMQLDPRLREHEAKKLVAEVAEACRQLPPASAIERVREALLRLPGNPILLKLESGISQKLSREQREQTLKEYLAKARVLLDDNLYLETAKVLEACQKEGFSSPELTELLEFAKAAAAERISQDLVERSFLEAKQLIADQDYEAVLKLLPPVLQRVEEPSLRKQLDEASAKQKELQHRIDELVSEVLSLREMELYDAAIGLIRDEGEGVQRAKRVQDELEVCIRMLEQETNRLESIGAVYACLTNQDCITAFRRAVSAHGNSTVASTAEIERRLNTRAQSIADQTVAKCIEAARQAMAADDSVLAETQIENASGWQSSASLSVQAEWKTIQSEISATKKVLRFRKASRR
jgi:eukaryotic-like serine/threonine-protein kinase